MENLAHCLPSTWPQAIGVALASQPALCSVAPFQKPAQTAIAKISESVSQIYGQDNTRNSARARLLEALLLYAVNALDECHQTFQEIQTFSGSYGHGMMHRREGDFWNANYWFRHAGKPPADVFPKNFDPVKLTAACELCSKGHNAETDHVIGELRAEWVAIVDALLNGRVQ
jgi:hypothetical protein